MKSVCQFSICLVVLLYVHPCYGQLTIAQARAAGANAVVTTKGLVTNGAELGTIRYFQDETAGLAVYDFNYATQINRGDSILVTGTLVDYNGLLEISTVTSLQVLSSGNTLPDTQTFSPAEIGEDQEGELVRINDVLFSAAGGTFAGNTSYPFTANGQTLSIYVRNNSPLVGQMIPPSTTDMVGIASQYLSNYQILPRDTNDFIAGPGIEVISTFTQSNLNYNGFSLDWTTNIPGSTGVRYGLTPTLELGNEYDVNAVALHSYTIVDLEAGQIYYCQGYSVANGDTAFTPIRPFGTISNSSGSMTAYFNTPCDTSVAIQQAAVQLFEAIDDTLIAYLDRAELSIDLTIYDFNNTEISNISQAVNDAVERGVVVRFISDGSLATTNTGITELASGVHHIYSPTGDQYNIMHNKFVVIDANHSNPLKPIVWTGSTNWTDRQINRDPNSVIIVQDQTLARAYTIEFNEMWGSTGVDADTTNSKFGPFKTDNTPHQFFIGNKNVECYFSPSDNVNSQLVETIELADSNAYFASMLITRQDIANALIDLNLTGGEVRGIIDNPSASGSQYTNLQTALDSTELFVNPDTNVIMHHKFLITDHAENLLQDPTLWVGSHNWTSSANTKNDENTLVIHDASLVNQYYQQLMYLISFEPVTGCTISNACNYNPAATISDASCLFIATPCDDGNPNTINDAVGFACICEGTIIAIVPGCTDQDACNFNNEATEDDGSCIYPGCNDISACNFSSSAGCDDGSCTYPGCMEISACNYNSDAGCDDGSCNYPGCIDTLACNFNPTATCADGSCIYPDGCTDTLACNYNSNALCENGSCAYPTFTFLNCDGTCVNDLNQDGVCDELVSGCSVFGACNYDSTDTNTDDDVCYFPGCSDFNACNYNANAACDNGSCTYPGCTNSLACNFDVTAGCDDNSCSFPGCTDLTACNYNALAACDDGSCVFAETFYNCQGNCILDTDDDGICDQLDLAGCIDSVACNYNAFAQNDDGSCTFPGCIDMDACNFSASAACPDSSCVFPGCSNPLACNYDASAGCEDGSCLFVGTACNDANNSTFNDTIGITCSCEGIMMIIGCIDPLACNYDELANTSDNSCQYTGDVCDDGDTTTTSDTLSVDCICQGNTVGLNESRLESPQINVYPNPVENYCTIELHGIHSDQALLRLTDLAGNIVALEQIRISQPVTFHRLDVTIVSKGVYLLEVTGKSYSLHNKIVVN
jgi:phosphatidylserine/phosphatidylglycerophosphate/cardiolipin synthase-like enzyme